jgi:hypothetical protein
MARKSLYIRLSDIVDDYGANGIFSPGQRGMHRNR